MKKLKILQVHKYFSRKRGGGSVTAFLETIRILKKHSQQVAVFAMQDPENDPSDYDKYFPAHFDLNKKMGFFQKIRNAFKIIYNWEAKKKLETLIENDRPQLAHLHNIYHYLSPSIIDALSKKQVPMVMTLHDYKLICPNYKLYTQGKLCEKCKGGKYYHCLIGRCLKNSFSYSLLAMLEAYIHRFRGTYRKVDLFLSPSKFLLEKCLEFGIPADKVQLLRYPFDIQSYDQYRNKDSYQEQNYYLYYGRLSEEKGIKDLILATKRLADAGKLKNNKLLIVGKGPQEEELKQLAKKVQLSSVIEFAGFQQGKNLTDIIQKAKFIVVPSVWYDNSPLVVIESQLLGKPVLVSDRGGTQESIIKNRTGFVFSAGKIGDLARKMEKLIVLAKEERQEMGRLGRENMQKINNEQLLYEKMMEIYAQVIEKRRSL